MVEIMVGNFKIKRLKRKIKKIMRKIAKIQSRLKKHHTGKPSSLKLIKILKLYHNILFLTFPFHNPTLCEVAKYVFLFLI
jgi:hypothetical protein